MIPRWPNPCPHTRKTPKTLLKPKEFIASLGLQDRMNDFSREKVPGPKTKCGSVKFLWLSDFCGLVNCEVGVAEYFGWPTFTWAQGDFGHTPCQSKVLQGFLHVFSKDIFRQRLPLAPDVEPCRAITTLWSLCRKGAAKTSAAVKRRAGSQLISRTSKTRAASTHATPRDHRSQDVVCGFFRKKPPELRTWEHKPKAQARTHQCIAPIPAGSPPKNNSSKHP